MKIPTSYPWLALAISFTGAAKAVDLNTTGFTNASITLSTGGKATCITGFLPISVTAKNVNLLTTGPRNNFETTELFIKYTQTNSTIVADLTGNTTVISGTYNIFSKLCFPTASVSNNDSAAPRLFNNNHTTAVLPKTVQILTHGGTLDPNYWDLSAPNNSYVDFAAMAGYATFSYARLETAPSDRPDGIQVVQMGIQVEILHHLAVMLQNTTNSSSNDSLENAELGYKFDKVVGVGHSIGAGLSQGVTNRYPTDFDAIVLMGHSTSFADAIVGSIGTSMQLARLDGSRRFEGLGNGYFSLGGGVAAHQYSFYTWPYFDVDLFNSQVAASQCNLLGELWTLASIYVPAPSFTGPVDIVDGVNDFFYCRGDCTYPENQAELALSTFYPAASNGSQTILLPNMGHNINAHFGAPDAFSQIIGFLQSNGIF